MTSSIEEKKRSATYSRGYRAGFAKAKSLMNGDYSLFSSSYYERLVGGQVEARYMVESLIFNKGDITYIKKISQG